MKNVKLLSDRDRARYHKLSSIPLRRRTDADVEELEELLAKMNDVANREAARSVKRSLRGV